MTDPTIKDEWDATARSKARDTMVAIKNSILAVIEHEDGRGRDTSALRAELLELEESLTTLRESGKCVGYAAFVARNQPVYDAYGAWMETNRREGHFTPFPDKIGDGSNRLMVECVGPSFVGSNRSDSEKRPPVTLNERS